MILQSKDCTETGSPTLSRMTRQKRVSAIECGAARQKLPLARCPRGTERGKSSWPGSGHRNQGGLFDRGLLDFVLKPSTKQNNLPSATQLVDGIEPLIPRELGKQSDDPLEGQGLPHQLQIENQGFSFDGDRWAITLILVETPWFSRAAGSELTHAEGSPHPNRMRKQSASRLSVRSATC